MDVQQSQWRAQAAKWLSLRGTTGGRLVAGSVLSIAGAAASAILNLALGIVSARMLGSFRYGELTMILSTVALFTTFGAMGLSITVSKQVAEYLVRDRAKAGETIGTALSMALAMGAVVAVVQMVASDWVCRSVLNAPEMAPGVRFSALIVLFTAAATAQTGALQGLEAFGTLAIANIVRGAVTLPFVTAGILAGGVSGALWGYCAANMMCVAVYDCGIRRACKQKAVVLSYRPDLRTVGRVLTFSIPVFLASVALTPSAWWSSARVGVISGYRQLGLFNAAAQWQGAILFFSNAIGSATAPTLTSILHQYGVGEYRAHLKRVFLASGGLATFIGVSVALGAQTVMRLYGRDFMQGTDVLQLVCLFAVINGITAPSGAALWTLDALSLGVGLAILGAAVLAAGAYFLAPLGAVGLALAYVMMAALNAVAVAVCIPIALRQKQRMFAAGA